jgi:hypothetical protein
MMSLKSNFLSRFYNKYRDLLSIIYYEYIFFISMLCQKIYIVPYSKDANTISLLTEPSLVKEFYSSIATMNKSTAG